MTLRHYNMTSYAIMHVIRRNVPGASSLYVFCFNYCTFSKDGPRPPNRENTIRRVFEAEYLYNCCRL